MVGKSRSKASRVFGLSGGTIRRWGGGTLAGQGGKCALQPPRKVATATISSVEFVLQVTLYLLLSGDGGIQRRSGGFCGACALEVPLCLDLSRPGPVAALVGPLVSNPPEAGQRER